MKVAALCITYCRPLLLQTAVRCFEQQTYSNKELVIVDDSPCSGLFAADHNLIEIRAPRRRLTMGAKWNIAAHATDADILILWDDDDWSAPDRIERQIQPILDGESNVSVLWQHVFHDERHPRRYLRRRGGEHQYPDGAIAFTRDRWLRKPFPSHQIRQWVGNDYAAIPAGELLVCRRHTFPRPDTPPCPMCQGASEFIEDGNHFDGYHGYACTVCGVRWQRANSSRPSDRWIHDPSLDGWREPWLS